MLILYTKLNGLNLSIVIIVVTTNDSNSDCCTMSFTLEWSSLTDVTEGRVADVTVTRFQRNRSNTFLSLPVVMNERNTRSHNEVRDIYTKRL